MKKSIPFWILCILVLWAVIIWFVPKQCCSGDATIAESTQNSNAWPAFMAKDGRFKSKCDSDFVFVNHTYTIKKPIPSTLGPCVGETAKYLKDNPNRIMTIEGLYMSNEKNQSLYQNLGIARAHSLKDYFVSKGANVKQFELTGKLVDTLKISDQGDVVAAGNYYFNERNNDRLAEVEKRLRANGIELYFQTNQSNLTLNDQQRSYISDLKYYMDNKDDATIDVTGHTDSDGAAASNLALSQRRAEYIKAYITKAIGISSNRITAAGKGETSPKATNNTPEGKALNRRVELKLH